jgi:hypothetical protein
VANDGAVVCLSADRTGTARAWVSLALCRVGHGTSGVHSRGFSDETWTKTYM